MVSTVSLYGSSRTLASTDSRYSSSRTSAASTPSTSHLVKHNWKMTMHPHEEGKL